MKMLAAMAVTLALASTGANAQAPSPNVEAEGKAAFAAARAAMQAGPADVRLADQATLHLPAKYVFIPQAQALRLLKAMGNRPSPDTLGMVFPQEGEENWFVVVRYVSSGYIKDDDARDWKADELLASIKEGTAEANKERRQRGIPEMEVVGWVERPAYDAATHRLVWSLSSRDKGAPASEEQGVNYNTYMLGREGYISMNLVTGMNAVEGLKPTARELLASLDFTKGKSYAEFNASTDRVAEYGLAALVGGIAAKKLGFFALLAAFFAKSIKLVILAVAGIGAMAVKFFRRSPES
jgi:uncharacterized membrane-anchored protein